MTFGGDQLDDNSGVLRYVRIEWAGIPIRPNDELNSLTLLGVGAQRSNTCRWMAAKDDGFEWFGGNVNGRHLVCSNMGDDCFDMDDGYHGKLQFLLAWQGDNFDIGSDSNGIESTTATRRRISSRAPVRKFPISPWSVPASTTICTACVSVAAVAASTATWS